MFSFFKRKSKYPPFRLLWTFEKREHYFVRNAGWGWLDGEQVYVTIPGSLQTTTLQDWEQHLFLCADGQHTVTAFIHTTANQYNDKIPDTLDHIIIDALLQLARQQLIVFTRTQQAVTPEFDGPGLQG
jgi:hypothetical protein